MDLDEILREWTTFKKDTEAVSKLLKGASRLDKDRMQHLPELNKQLTQLDRLIELLLQNTELLEAVQDWTNQYREKLTEAQQNFKNRFGIELEQALEKSELSLSGQYPNLRAWLFTIEPDLSKGRVNLWYGPKQERLTSCSLSVSEVAKSVAEQRKQIGSHLPPEELIQRLQDAYARTTGNKDDSAVPITSVLAELAYLVQDTRFYRDPRREYYKSYRRADFSYDLFLIRRWLRSAPSYHMRLQLTVATRTHTRRRQDFLWIPDNDSGQGTTYSHLQFVRQPHE